MSLIQKPPMTDNNRTAHQRNGRQSRGAATPQGKERSRAAHLRHGFYSQQRRRRCVPWARTRPNSPP